MTKKLVITLGKNGSRKVEAVGFVGSECKDKSDFLSRIFGGVDRDLLKPEYYETETENVIDTDGLPGGGRFCG